MKTKPKLTMEFSEDSTDVNVTYRDDVGDVLYKTVDINDLIGEMKEFGQLSTGMIPLNTRWFSGTQSNYTILLEFPAKVRNFSLFVPARACEVKNYKPELIKIPFPSVIAIFRISQNKIITSNIYAIQNQLLSEKDTIYRFPFGNTYEDGKVCWGGGNSNILTNIKSPMHLLGTMAAFFDLPYNGDLSVGAFSDKKHKDFWALIASLRNESVFPNEILVKPYAKLEEILRG